MKKKMKKITKHKKELVLGIIVGIILIGSLIFAIVSFTGNSSSENKDNSGNQEENNGVNNGENNDDNVDYGTSDEATIIKVYGMSSDDAIALVKKNFHSDNFEFTVEISQDVTYIVTAKNTITNVSYKYEVNPETKEYYEI